MHGFPKKVCVVPVITMCIMHIDAPSISFVCVFYVGIYLTIYKFDNLFVGVCSPYVVYFRNFSYYMVG